MTTQKPPQYARKRLAHARDKLGDLTIVLGQRLPDDAEVDGLMGEITGAVEDAHSELNNAVCDAEFALARL